MENTDYEIGNGLIQIFCVLGDVTNAYQLLMWPTTLRSTMSFGQDFEAEKLNFCYYSQVRFVQPLHSCDLRTCDECE